MARLEDGPLSIRAFEIFSKDLAVEPSASQLPTAIYEALDCVVFGDVGRPKCVIVMTSSPVFTSTNFLLPVRSGLHD